jgi:coenzyme F420-reducing hydrogenase delta subunit
MAYLSKIIEAVGIDPRRLKLDWVSASEGDRFSKVVNDFTAEMKRLGPIY